MKSLVIALGLIGVALSLLALRAARRFAGWLLAFAGLGVVGLVAYALGAQANATRQVAQVAQVQAVTSAGVTLTLVLLLFLVVLLGVVGALVAGWLWWKERQHRRRLLEFLWLNQVYGLSSDIRSGSALHGAQSGGPVIILPAYPPFVQGPYPCFSPDTPAQWQEPDPLAGLLPE